MGTILYLGCSIFRPLAARSLPCSNLPHTLHPRQEIKGYFSGGTKQPQTKGLQIVMLETPHHSGHFQLGLPWDTSPTHRAFSRLWSDMLKYEQSRPLTSEDSWLHKRQGPKQSEKRNSEETDHTDCRRNLNKTTLRDIIRKVEDYICKINRMLKTGSIQSSRKRA